MQKWIKSFQDDSMKKLSKFLLYWSIVVIFFGCKEVKLPNERSTLQDVANIDTNDILQMSDISMEIRNYNEEKKIFVVQYLTHNVNNRKYCLPNFELYKERGFDLKDSFDKSMIFDMEDYAELNNIKRDSAFYYCDSIFKLKKTIFDRIGAYSISSDESRFNIIKLTFKDNLNIVYCSDSIINNKDISDSSLNDIRSHAQRIKRNLYRLTY